MRLVANKAKAKYNENVLLTTYGCDFGYVEWKIGDNMILGHELDPKRQVTQTGPGFYKARCKNDFMVNSDWVTTYVELDGSIVPVINGPNSLCPNTAATITTAGCPSGYYNSWSTLEQGGFSYGGNSVTVYLPQTVKLRCIKKDNSWGSDEKPLTIVSAIPDDIKVTSNSPVVSGGTALLTGTSVSGATYLWTPPAGVTLPVLNTRDLQIPNVTPAYSGEYKLKMSSGGCQVEVSARVDVDLCDNLYIKAFDPQSGDEKTRLNRKSGQLNLYDDLVLQVETFDGEILKGVEYTWTLPQGVTAGQDPAQQHKITINKIGNYKVNVTSTGGVTCPLEVDISALACATPTDFLNCGSTSTVTSTGTEKLKNLAVGDVFSTYDYVVSVTEVSGSESTGWTGRGVIEMSFLKLGATALSVPLAVRFDNIHLNQCYQLLPGSKVTTEFDEEWSNVVSVGEAKDMISKIYEEIRDLLSTPNNNAVLQAKILELQDLKEDLGNFPGLGYDFVNENRIVIDGVIETLSCHVGSSSGRIANTCTADDVEESLDASVTSEMFVSFRDLPDGEVEFSGPGPKPILFVANLLVLEEIGEEIKVLKILHPDWADSKIYLTASWNVYKGIIHTALDMVGMVPVAGEFADGINATIYMAEGDKLNASLSAISMLPVAGDAIGKSGKVTRKVIQWFKVGDRYFSSPTRKAAYEVLLNQFSSTKVADAIWDARNSKVIREIIIEAGKALNTTWQAHHIIPKELIEQSLTLRNAINQGFDFNQLENLIPLAEARHLGSHGNYTVQVKNLIERIERDFSFFTDKQKIEKAVGIIATKIGKTTGKINDLTFSL